MSIRRMTLGAGYRYLMSSVARMDEAGPAAGLTAYYAAKGTPAGRFLGAGLAGLGEGRGIQAGDLVGEEALWRMLGMLQDPLTGQALGRAPAQLGGVWIDREGRVRPAPKTVAGFDLAFSVPKSVSVAWALADETTKERIHAAHEAAIGQVIAYAEKHVFATRVGKAGAVSVDVRGVVAAKFDHWDSRAGDPQLHTHVMVLNRAQAVTDGAWRTLDSKSIFRHTVALSELYNGLLQDELTRVLGWSWTPEARPRASEPIWEVEGVPKGLREAFSQRSAAIRADADGQVEQFLAAHGRRPTPVEVLRMRQHATLATRPDKQVHSLAELTATWRARAVEHAASEGLEWLATLERHNRSRGWSTGGVEEGMKRDLARVVLARVADKRATFTRANLLAETHRQLRAMHFATPTDRIACGEQVATCAAQIAVKLTPDVWSVLPEDLLREDGSSRLRARNSEVYSTRETMDAESCLLEAGRAVDGPGAPVTSPDAASMPPASAAGSRVESGRGLTLEQGAAVAAVVGSRRRLDVLVGAAGTGKSTTMAAVRAAWEAEHGPGSVIGLAPSAAAAEVLADAVGIPTENTTKWICENTRNPERRARLDEYAARLRGAQPSLETRAVRARAETELAEYRRWALAPGQLVIIDEASMAATADLDHITTEATRAGAKVLLVGDWAQLSPVQAGGAFKMLVDDRPDAPELREVHRFRHAWERVASLRLREGDPAAVADYLTHERVASGQREDLLDAMFTAWCTNLAGGRSSLMLAADSQTVDELNARAQAHRTALGQVTVSPLRTGDGTPIGVGDLVVTRLNRRALATGRGWVHNGDDWTVTHVNDDGSLEVARPDGSGAHLPAEYVADHVELGYATTAYRAQGRTVDAAHAYVTIATVREPLYVMATRGRESNQLYVDAASDPFDGDHNPAATGGERLDPGTVLEHVMTNSGLDVAAHDVARAETRRARSQEMMLERSRDAARLGPLL